MEAIFLVCGAGGPQLKRNPLGSSANMLRFVIALSLCVLAPGIAPAQGQRVDSLLSQCEPTEGTNGCVYRTSIAQLLARPELYNGKRVRLTGYIHFQLEDNGIYRHRQDELRHRYRSGLWVQFKNGVPRPADCQDAFVIVEGTFAAHHHGHLGLWPGAVIDITRCIHSG